MVCKSCGRILKSERSMALGYGPVCYEKEFGKSKIFLRNKRSSGIDDIPYYDIPGQITIDEYIKTLLAK